MDRGQATLLLGTSASAKHCKCPDYDVMCLQGAIRGISPGGLFDALLCAQDPIQAEDLFYGHTHHQGIHWSS